MADIPANANSTAETASIIMDKINTTILKTAIEAIPLLTQDNYTLWKNRVENMLDLQELLTPLTSPTGVLSSYEDVQLRTILTSKLESTIHANVITHDNEKSSKKIWKSISDYFASSQASNPAQVFNAVLHIQFNPNDVRDFINQVKSALSRLHEVGIDLPKDIIAYLILHKLPPSMINISQQITHSEKPITTDLVLDHLCLYSNDQQILAISAASSKSVLVFLLTDDSKKCKKGWHKPRSTGHTLPNCWFLYPHLRPSQDGEKGKKSEQSVSSFHSSSSKPSASFVLDSGSSSHMISDINLFISLDHSEQGVVRTSSGEESLEIKGIGSVKLIHEHGELFLHQVLYVPNLIINLLSVRCLALEDYNVQFFKHSFSISRNNNLLISGHYEGNLPCLNFSNVQTRSFLSSAEELHKSLGHNVTKCEACALGKITKASFKSKHQRAKRPFKELHLDLIGPITPISREGDKYILTVVDSNTRYCSAIPINKKSDVVEILSTIIDYEAKRFGYHPSVLHSDRGGEFINMAMEDYCQRHLIKHRTADPYTPQQNGLAERHNRTIIESLQTILTDSKISNRFWNDIVKVSTLTLNQIPSHRSNKSPYELFRGRSLPLDYFHPLGNPIVFLNEPKKPGTKIYPKGSRGKLIGYNEELLSYCILAEDGRIIDTKSVQFLEFRPEEHSFKLDDDEEFEIVLERGTTPQIIDETNKEAVETKNEELTELLNPAPVTRVLRERTAKIKPIRYSCLTSDPSSFKKAINSEEKERWIQAANDELNSIESHEVWEDMWDTPESHLRTTWVFRTKPATLSSVEKKKAQLCIQGFLQLPGVDYNETFAPTGKFSTLLILLTLAVEKQLPLRQFDVKAAFLYAPLKETIYIKTPKGSKRKSPFLRLKKSLNGLKQAPANWFKMLTSWLKDINYVQSSSNPCLFSHKDGDSFVFFHVNDSIVAGKVDAFEDLFLLRFPNSSAHDPDTLLGMELNQNQDSVLHCWKYLKGTIDLKLTLRPDSSDGVNNIKYYTDATWADDLESRLSRSGSICFWKSCPIAWNSKKQNNIALSSTEAELNTLSDGVQESQWITYLIEELWKEKLEPSEFNVDHLGLLEKIKNFGSNSKTKHLDIKMKWLREMKNSNQINVKLIPSEDMVADALTKASNASSLQRLQQRCFLVLFSPS
ncbi:hypothetical protein VP01_734g4 [Puccinia sorghi]|uniref:Integrase catalytic domain-containing protein n=1 Tax=Puccinia sorghi TaxID=27349 RepID=A0A0L6UCT5_9BASI|nr:hypothetical protein VP01_734g4 [Puccinia sorghi]